MGEVYIVGHTDSIGGDAYNHKLSSDRAAAVMGWLSRHESIPAAIMVGRGLGSTKPVAHNTTMPDGSDNPEGRARNRRVEILLATREGVDIVKVAGLVVVGAQGVEAGDGAIRIDESGVRVGDVEVTAGGIRVGGVTVGADSGVAGDKARLVDDERPAFCKTGEICSLRCPYGDCQMTCQSGAKCEFSCTGGDCTMRCDPGAVCDFHCSGGDCSFDCANGSVCRTTCTGGGCARS